MGKREQDGNPLTLYSLTREQELLNTYQNQRPTTLISTEFIFFNPQTGDYSFHYKYSTKRW